MAKAADTTNKFDREVVRSLVNKIEGYFGDLLNLRMDYMRDCKPLHESIRAVYDEAKARGIPKKELKAFVTARQKLEKARQVLADLEADQRETVELLADVFGDAADLPLFESKIRKAQAAQDGASAEGSTARH